MKKVIVKKGFLGLLFREGVLKQILQAGEYQISRGEQLVNFDTRADFKFQKGMNTIMKRE